MLDSAGRLIGVNAAIYSPSGAYAGIGFAIPVDTVNAVVPHLIRYGRVMRPTLGVELASTSVTRRLGIEGALVLRVIPGGPADRAELRPTRRDRAGRIVLGDVIVAIDEEKIRNANDVTLAMEHFKPGDTVKVTIVRDEQRQTARVTLDRPS